MINKNGEITNDLVDEFSIDRIKILDDNYFDGFIFVEKEINDVVMTGVLNSNLEYVIEPTAKFNDIEPKDNFLYYGSAIGFYDALENEFIEEDEYKIRHIQRCFPEGGIIFLSLSYGNTFVYSSKHVRGEIELDDTCKTGFYNQNLEMILDVSFYLDVQPLSDFQDGKCLIEFKTEQGNYNVGLINLEGNFIFVESDDYIRHDANKIEFRNCYFDWNGNYYQKDSDTST